MNANNGLVARGFGKTFAGRTVLSGVDLTIRPGEVRALLGHNGSGKSTFVKLLAGVHPPDPGATLTLGGEPVVLPYPGERPPDRLRFVHQDLGLVGTLSGTENFALGRGFRLRRDGSIDWRAERAFARAHLQAFDPSIDPDVPVSELTPAQRSVIAIARAVQDADDSWSALVLDEPTAALPLEEAARLYEVIRTLSARGTSILLVTHRLDEVLDLCDTATVLRDGRVAADVHVGDLDKRSLIELIVGGPTDDVFARAATRDGDVVLDVRDVTGTSLRAFDLTVRAGEVVGVAGLTGSGREEIVPLLSQDIAPRAGSVRIHGREIAGGGARRAIRAGVGSVPADRLGKAAIGAFTVRENITLPRLSDLLRPASSGGTIDADRERTDVLGWIAETAVRPADPEIPFARLSGGNQQKAVLARWLRYRPDVLLIDEPTQGVDVGAKHQIYELLARAAEDGMAVVIASTDDDELARIAQRVVVLVDGRVHDELSGDRLSVNALARASLGDAPSSPHDPLGRKAS